MANPGKNTDNSTAMKNRDERSHTTAKPAPDRGNRAVKAYGKKDQFEPMKIKPTEEDEEKETGQEDEDMPSRDTGAKSWESSKDEPGIGTFGNRPYGKKDDPHAGERSARGDRTGRSERPERNAERGERPSGFGTGRGDLNAKPSKEKEIGKEPSAVGQETTYADDDEEEG